MMKKWFRALHIHYDKDLPDDIPKGSKIIYAVHHSNGMIDPMLVSLCHPPQTLTPVITAKATLFSIPILSHIFRYHNVVPLFRRTDNVNHSSQGAFATLFNALEKYHSIVICPEGRSHDHDDRVLDLRPGIGVLASQMAQTAPVIIVPVALSYPLGKNAWRPPVIIMFGKAILITETNVKSVEDILIMVHQGMQHTLDCVRNIPFVFPEIKDWEEFISTIFLTLFLFPGQYINMCLKDSIHKFMKKKKAMELDKNYKGNDLMASIDMFVTIVSSIGLFCLLLLFMLFMGWK
jgi:1-acyl-sn-glycerol-3-phosphate acyltransferase